MSVVTSGHDVADARLHREVAAFQRAGLSVEVLGLGDAASAPPGATARTRPRPGLAGRAVSAVVRPWQARGRVLVCLDPDVLPSASVRRLTGRKVVADVHEDYLALLKDRRWARGITRRAAQSLARAATRLASRTDLVVVADDHVPPLTGRERLVVRNLPDASLLPDPTEPGATPRALYVGDLRASRGLFTMLEAAEQAPDWELDLVGPVSAADLARLETWRATSPAADRVRFHGRLEPRAAWDLARGAWVGLALLDRTPAFEAAVPTKLYEYLACGLAVVVTPLPRMVGIVEASGAGAVVSDAEGAAATLTRWAAERSELMTKRAAGLGWWAAEAEGSPYDVMAERVRALSRPGRG